MKIREYDIKGFSILGMVEEKTLYIRALYSQKLEKYEIYIIWSFSEELSNYMEISVSFTYICGGSKQEQKGKYL